MTICDAVVIGGGMAGAAAACELAARLRVVLVERESVCGYHSTGRSAASFTENYGNTVIRQLARAGRAFFEHPPAGFTEYQLVRPRGMLTIARADQRHDIDRELARANEFAPTVHAVDRTEALRLVPILRPDYLADAILEPGSLDIDVHALHQGFLRSFGRRGGRVVVNAAVSSLTRRNGAWQVQAADRRFSAGLVFNAGGAWADMVGELAGLPPLGLVPKRRTAFNIAAPAGHDPQHWPLVNDVGGEFYFKPDAGQLLVSPADATPSVPTDAQPEELDIAIGVDRIERATTMRVERVAHKWAGLRTFAADGSPVVGFDELGDGFFWLAGQGGYGIKTAPALARATAGLVFERRLPRDLLGLGLCEGDLSPSRLRASALAPTDGATAA